VVFSVCCDISSTLHLSYDKHGFDRIEAYNSYKASPSFSYWDPTVLETFIKYGITEDNERGLDAVKLKGPVFLVRISSFADPLGLCARRLVPYLSPSLEYPLGSQSLFRTGVFRGNIRTIGNSQQRHRSQVHL
jgi:hypothetical protein